MSQSEHHKMELLLLTKFLGVIISNQLNWKTHLDHVCTKIAKILVKFWKPGTFLKKKNTLLSLYHSLIYPYLTCCIQVWGATYQSHLSKLMILQKKIVRIIHGVPPRTHTEPLFLVFNVLKVSNLYRYNIAFFMYKLNNSVLPDIFPMFIHNYENHNYETRQLKQFHILMCHANLTNISIKYQGPLVWNDISSNVDVNCCIGTFKKRAKTYFAGDYV